jgi:hypothetical protein
MPIKMPIQIIYIPIAYSLYRLRRGGTTSPSLNYNAVSLLIPQSDSRPANESKNRDQELPARMPTL